MHTRACIYFRPTTAFRLYSEEVAAVRREEVPSNETRLRIVFKNPSHLHPGVSLAKRGRAVCPLWTVSLGRVVPHVVTPTTGSFCPAATVTHDKIFNNHNTLVIACSHKIQQRLLSGFHDEHAHERHRMMLSLQFGRGGSGSPDGTPLSGSESLSNPEVRYVHRFT